VYVFPETRRKPTDVSHDMAKPRQADRVVEVAYAIAMIVNVLVSVSGYLMYGTEVSDEACHLQV
jgi:hypothetical protein